MLDGGNGVLNFDLLRGRVRLQRFDEENECPGLWHPENREALPPGARSVGNGWRIMLLDRGAQSRIMRPLINLCGRDKYSGAAAILIDITKEYS